MTEGELAVASKRVTSPSDDAGAQIGRRERAKDAKRRKIIEVARRLFDEKGFARTTTQEIAAAADIGTGTLFLYAPTKEDLLVMVFRDEIMALNRRAFETAPADVGLLEQLMHVFRRMIAYHERDIELARILIKQVTVPNNADRLEDVNAMLVLVHTGIAGFLEQDELAGELEHGLDRQLAAETLFSIYYMALLRWLGGHEHRDMFLEKLPLLLSSAITGLARR